MKNAMQLIKDYKQVMTTTTVLPDRIVTGNSNSIDPSTTTNEEQSSKDSTTNGSAKRGRPQKHAVVLRNTSVITSEDPQKASTSTVTVPSQEKSSAGSPHAIGSTTITLTRLSVMISQTKSSLTLISGNVTSRRRFARLAIKDI